MKFHENKKLHSISTAKRFIEQQIIIMMDIELKSFYFSLTPPLSQRNENSEWNVEFPIEAIKLLELEKKNVDSLMSTQLFLSAFSKRTLNRKRILISKSFFTLPEISKPCFYILNFSPLISLQLVILFSAWHTFWFRVYFADFLPF